MRPRLRSGASASTSSSNGRSWWAKAPRARVRPQQLAKRRVAAGVGPQHEGVREVPDQRFRLHRPAVRHRRAEKEVVLAGVALEQDLEGGEQDHEEARLRLQGEPLESAGQGLGQGRRPPGAAGRLDRLPRLVGRELQGRSGARELPAPVAELGFEDFALQPAPLPESEVRVLDGQRRQGRRPAGRERLVQGADLPHQDPHRPPVRHDVVQVDREDVLVAPEPHQKGAQQGAGREVERTPGLLVEQAAGHGFPPPGRQRRQVQPRQQGAHRPRNLLGRPPVQRGESRPQDLVPADHLAERRFQGHGVERTREPHGERDVVDRALRVELVQEPEPVLGEGQRQLLRGLPRTEAHRLRSLDPFFLQEIAE